MTSPLPRLTSHGLSAPTGVDVRRALRAVVPDSYEQLWGEVCRQAGLHRGCYLLQVPELERLTAAIAARPGPVGVVGRALAVRVGSYRALAEQDGQERRGSYDWARTSMELLLQTRPASPGRLEAIAGLDLFSAVNRAALDKAARQVAHLVGAPIGLVSVVADSAQLFAGSHGLSGWLGEVGGTPVEWSFCATMVRTREAYVVADAAHDLIQRTNPLHTKHGVTGYLGVPLLSSAGHVLGSLCAISDTRLEVGEAKIDEMRAAAASLAREVEANRTVASVGG